MKHRERAFLPALALLFLCLAGCGGDASDADPAAACEGVWYAAKNGVECRFGDGKIYRDDSDAQEGQTLAGIYRYADGHMEANLAGAGDVSAVRTLYLVDGEQGEILCDHADGSGTIYFYREALAALAVLDAREAAAEPADSGNTPAPTEELPSEPPEADETAQPPASETPADTEDNRDADPPPTSNADAPEPSAQGNSELVWIPQSGSKYHRDPSCSGMKNPKQVPLSQAIGQGYTACKRCY